jgi:hypothetical protein
MRKPAWALAAALTLLAAPGRAASTKPAEAIVASSRVYLGALVSGLPSEVADIDLGASPAAGGSRVFTRDDLLQALHDHGADDPKSLPSAVRVTRKTRRLDAAEIDRLVREALGSKLPRGVTLSAVHGPHVVDVPDGWTSVSAELPAPPRRTGPVASAVHLAFLERALLLCALSVPVDLQLSPEAAIYDLTRGGRVTLIVRHGLVEVTVSATAAADADVGSLVPVVLHPSGRVLSARLEDPEHAVVETP